MALDTKQWIHDFHPPSDAGGMNPEKTEKVKVETMDFLWRETFWYTRKTWQVVFKKKNPEVQSF